MRFGTLISVLSLRRNSIVIGGVIGTLLLFCSHAAGQAVADTSALRVQILSGKTGRPVTNARVRLFRNAHLLPLDGNKVVITDGEGYAPLPNVDGSVGEVFVAVEAHRACSKTEKHDFELVKVRTAGVVSENSCRPRITMYPQLGTLIFYVRDETFLERMRK